jgi:hypothetical protein
MVDQGFAPTSRGHASSSRSPTAVDARVPRDPMALAPRAGSRCGRPFRGSWLPTASVTILVSLLLGIAALGGSIGVSALLAGTNGVTSSGGGPAIFTPEAAAVCNAPSYTSASSLLITLPDPTGTLAAGGSLTVVFQLAVQATTVSTAGMNATLPSVFATFPLVSGSDQLFFAGANVPIPASGWFASTAMNKTIVVGSALSFKTGASATLSTQKLAVMAPVNYTKLTLEFRWSWSYVQPNGTSQHSLWTVPTATNQLPAQLRSIFFPAPYVSFLNSSGASATIGANYTATIGGAVSGRYFLLEMEFPGTGKVVQAQAQTAPASATTFTVFIPMLGYTNSLAPGPYLVHIHDACGALLYNKSVLAVFAASATVHFAVSPTSCGVKFDGSSWFNGTAATVTPSIVPYSMSVGCANNAFKSWSGGGGVHVNNGTSLLVSATGTFTVVYA